MPIILPSISICTPLAWPGCGNHSEYGKLVPTMSSVSQFSIMSFEGLVPSKPIEPVTKGRSSGSAARPLRAFATPHPRMSTASFTSSAALNAPAPINMATFSPEFSTSAARRKSSSCGITRGGGGESDLGEDRAMSARRLLIVGLGHVVGHDDAGNRAGRLRDADGPVDEVGRLLRDHENLDELVRHVLVQRHQVDLLLIVAP